MYGLDGYRFEADEMMFATPDTNPDNWCYCNGECPPAGELQTRRPLQSCIRRGRGGGGGRYSVRRSAKAGLHGATAGGQV